MNIAAHTYQAIDGAPIAKTNVLHLPISDADLVRKLLKASDGQLHIDYFCREVAAKSGENTEQYYRRVHSEAKKVLRVKLELPADAVIRYEVLQSVRTFYFFYLSDTPSEHSSLLEDFASSTIPLHRLVGALIGLQVKLDLLEQARDQYDIEPVHHNAAIYLATDVYPRKKDGRVLLDTFEARFYFSPDSELVTTLHNRTFLASAASSLHTPLEDTVLTFRAKKASYDVGDKVDSRQYGRKKFMRFQASYRGCQNHAHTLVARSVMRILNNIDVLPVPQTFQAGAGWGGFITAESQAPIRQTVIVDNYGAYPSDEVMENVHRQLRDALGHCQIMPASEIEGYDALSEEFNYVVLNKGIGRNGSSIRDAAGDKSFNSFWQAYQWRREGKGRSLDLYTRIKIAHLDEKRSVVMQGLDLPETFSARDGNYLNPHVVEKMKKELWIKESVIQRRAVTGLHSLPAGSYALVYVRKPEGMFFASVIACHLSDDTVRIDAQKTYTNEDELKFVMPVLSKFETLFDQGFYLYDSAAAVMLTAYTNGRVPQIMGNAGFDNVERYNASGDTLRKLTVGAENPLPYYITPRLRGQYHHIFLQESGKNLFYFVSPKGNPQSTFSTQCRVYNILTWGSDGAPLRQLSQDVTSMFLRSFTDDILLNGQVSKSSLLLKAARLFIEN